MSRWLCSVPYNTAAAVAAYHTRRPVRICLDRDEDMQTSGHRHAFVGKYKVGAWTLLSTVSLLEISAGL